MNIEMKLELNSIDRVKSFVEDVTLLDGEYDLVSGKYIVDAKSIMGIFSLNLAEPVILKIVTPSEIDISVLEKYKVR